MLPEDDVVLDPDDVVRVVGVVRSQVLQQFELDARLVLESLLVPDQLYGHYLLRLVVEALQRLPEAALPQELEHLEPEADLVMQHHNVVASFVVVAVVVLVLGGALDLLSIDPQEVDLLVVQYLALLVVSQLLHVVLQRLRSRHRERQLLLLYYYCYWILTSCLLDNWLCYVYFCLFSGSFVFAVVASGGE